MTKTDPKLLRKQQDCRKKQNRKLEKKGYVQFRSHLSANGKSHLDKFKSENNIKSNRDAIDRILIEHEYYSFIKNGVNEIESSFRTDLSKGWCYGYKAFHCINFSYSFDYDQIALSIREADDNKKVLITYEFCNHEIKKDDITFYEGHANQLFEFAKQVMTYKFVLDGDDNEKEYIFKFNKEEIQELITKKGEQDYV